jgi:hypothetical protein
MYSGIAMTTTIDVARPPASTSSKRYDPLAQFSEPPPRAPIDLRAAARTFWAFCLLVAGVGVTVWLIVLIHAAVFKPHTVGLLDRLAPSRPEDLTLTLPAGKVELPPAGMTVIGYFFLVLLTSIAARIVAMMIKQGVSLLQSERKPEAPEPDFALPPLPSAK